MRRLFGKLNQWFKNFSGRASARLFAPVYFGRHLAGVPVGALVFFPCRAAVCHCGLAGLVAVKRAAAGGDAASDLTQLEGLIARMETGGDVPLTSPVPDDFLGGDGAAEALLAVCKRLKEPASFCSLYAQADLFSKMAGELKRISALTASAAKRFKEALGRLARPEVDRLTVMIDTMKDAAWCLSTELTDNIHKVRGLLGEETSCVAVSIYREINAVLNSIDRLEVRGRDSAGISVMLCFTEEEFSRLEGTLSAASDAGAETLLAQLQKRSQGEILLNRSIAFRRSSLEGDAQVAVTFVYKVAAEIGSLGDNIRFIREQITTDTVLKAVARGEHFSHSICSHTRWASVGAITVGNCHPVDNRTKGTDPTEIPVIHAVLNGDIDNYLELKKDLAKTGTLIPDEITTDTKIIPLQIEKYIKEGNLPLEAFRLAVNDFHGSHAIAMHTDLAPGKLFLAQKGSGQAVFIGLAESHYMPVSEVYGFVEETSRYLKMAGEKIVEGKNGPTQGQIFVLNQDSEGGLSGLTALCYDGTPIVLGEQDILQTHLTSRDIDRQGFPHYFLKEISESPSSVERTLQNRWKEHGENRQYKVVLDETVVCERLQKALRREGTRLRRIYFIGQGTAGVAAQACANIMAYYLGDSLINVSAMKSSELSGFKMEEELGADSMKDALIVAISQSGTTTDTNRAVDMVKLKGAHTLAIVNRRDSDLTFKTDGVLYTSSGRDIEMSVASTKAFYSQIIAGALLGLHFAELNGRRSAEFISQELANLLLIPDRMRKVLEMKAAIEVSAKRLAPSRTYWAVVGSGPNKAAADEIRIKLSELCYKTISSDFVEDKKHIDLSSEPLILICAAGTKETVLGDIIKDTAIFKAHKAAPVVITDEGEERFAPYAEDVFQVPAMPQHLSPILNTLAGHLWGYYAALAINESSKFLYGFREGIRKSMEDHAARGLDIFEMVLEPTFRETIAEFYNQFRMKKSEKKMPTPITLASDLILLLKYLSGRLPASDFELDFNKKGTARNMIDTLFAFMGESINAMARPVDAIKHQAKTVTVGTSRISEKVEGHLFDILTQFGVALPQLTTSNIVVLKNLQGIVDQINGAICYHIDGLNLLGEPTDQTTIRVEKKTGILAQIPSRVEADKRLKGSKQIIVRQGNVYIGKGRKDDRSILVIPIISSSPKKPNIIEHLLLLNIGFKADASLPVKIKALGGKYDHIKSIIQENSVAWKDTYLETVPMEDLFGISAEKVGEYILSHLG